MQQTLEQAIEALVVEHGAIAVLREAERVFKDSIEHGFDA